VTSVPSIRVRFGRIDALLLLMTIIWGTNFSIIKRAFAEVNPQAFNAMRMIIASCVFLAIIFVLARLGARKGAAVAEVGDPDSVASIFHTPAPLTRSDWLALAGLGVVGHFLYQYCFIGGLALTSVANSSLILAATPVTIALMTGLLGQERVGRYHWLGATLSIAGVYIVVGHGGQLRAGGLRGDVLMFAAVCCWAVYTLGSRPLMRRHSPVGVTGLSMAIGTLLYVPSVWNHLRGVAWLNLRLATWGAIVYSALLALCVAYTIWYAAVREIGGARTSVYSNLVPIVAMATAVLFLQEPVGAAQLAGGVAVLAGVALTRVGGSRTG
jgi:drug/metabolite transporter (DMT)-like permease